MDALGTAASVVAIINLALKLSRYGETSVPLTAKQCVANIQSESALFAGETQKAIDVMKEDSQCLSFAGVQEMIRLFHSTIPLFSSFQAIVDEREPRWDFLIGDLVDIEIRLKRNRRALTSLVK